MTTRYRTLAIVLSAVLALLVGTTAAVSARSSGPTPKAAPVPFEDSRLKVEINATDGDAGLQPFIDSEDGWKHVKILNPSGDPIFEASADSRVRRFGFTELFSESSEPPFAEFPIEKFKKLFPEGKYKFRGRTVDGAKLIGSAKLTHDFPDAPAITAPADAAMVPLGTVLVQWNDVTTPPGIVIDSYQVTVEREDPLRVFSVDLPASTNSVTVPAEFLESGVDYSVEVLAIEQSGNQTLTNIHFSVM